MFRKNKKLIPSQPYTPPQSYSAITMSGQDDGDFTKSYVPEDEGSGYMLGYLSIVFGLLFNVIGMVLGVISIVKGVKKQKVVLSLLGIVGIVAGVFSLWLYAQAFQFLLPGVAYDGDEKQWVIEQDDTSNTELRLQKYTVRSPDGQEFELSLAADLNVTGSEGGAAYDFEVGEESDFDIIGDFKATAFFFLKFSEAQSLTDLRSLTNQVIAQDMTSIEEASFGLLRETHFGIVPDSIRIIEPTYRVNTEHPHFEDILVFEVAFDRLVDRQIIPTEAHVWLLYDTEQIMALLLSTPEQSQLGLRQFGLDAVGSFTPLE